MKTTLRSLILVLLAAVGSMTLPVGGALGADEVRPAEIINLIGVTIPPIVAGKSRANVPSFVAKESIGGGSGTISYEYGVIGDRWPVLIVESINEDRALKILNIQMLPANQLDWRYENGKFLELEGHLHVSFFCKSSEKDKRNIFGLIKPERDKSGCVHLNSKQVKQAWLVDGNDGRIISISPRGLTCVYEEEGENECE